jgi:hypothetical protein
MERNMTKMGRYSDRGQPLSDDADDERLLMPEYAISRA